MRLSVDEMRELGHAAVDLIAERTHDLGNRPVARRWTREELEKALREPVPTDGRDPLRVLDRVAADILPACAATDHPRFFAYVPSPGNFVAAVADFLASGANVFAGHWLAGAGAAQVELIVLDWLRDLLGLPASAGGILTSGGTQATLVAIHAARMDRLQAGNPGARIYVTRHTHAAIVRGLAYLGFIPDQVHAVPTTDDQVMDAAALQAAIDADHAAGAVPLCVVATAGTTSTGAIDPLNAIADVCHRSGVWFHVDAAYGGAAVLSTRARPLLDGIGRADSIAMDPHKWWFQPYEAGCTLVRDAEKLRRAYTLDAVYLTEARAADDPVNFYDYGPQLTRSFRALKIWMTLQTFGLNTVREAVEHGITLAEQTESLIRANPRWDVVTPARLGVVTFRPHLPGLDDDTVHRITRQIAQDTLTDGHAMVFTTDLGSGPVLRMCTIHPETTTQDIGSTLDTLDRLLAHVGGSRPPGSQETRPRR
ncbi:L-2,4-diaminobutyrate decarboxylase [Virgisporangium aurantiacum]|uniref:L-2,4-diaminobutyrate decarboxylase n=2 Tax=Virgisporangium aurantiacum TaxID=175570 RepID=A0A8J4E1Y7_9ACTN|nr:L-2,4-diaminobutyrate decarboxylase [Virgisporangium aurantiacum]